MLFLNTAGENHGQEVSEHGLTPCFLAREFGEHPAQQAGFLRGLLRSALHAHRFATIRHAVGDRARLRGILDPMARTRQELPSLKPINHKRIPTLLLLNFSNTFRERLHLSTGSRIGSHLGIHERNDGDPAACR